MGLPQHCAASLPQAAILQQTAEYIFSLEQEKTRLLQQNAQLKRFIQVPRLQLPGGEGGFCPHGEGRGLLLTPPPTGCEAPSTPSAASPPFSRAMAEPGSSLQEFSGSSPKRRRAEDKDEGIGSPDIWEDEKAEDLRREMIELRQQLDKERSVRMMLEEQVRAGGGALLGGCTEQMGVLLPPQSVPGTVLVGLL